MQPVGTAATFQKAGLTYEDHHAKDKDGNFQSSPPRELKVLYDYLPSEKEKSSKKVPARISLQAEINSLKHQAHCEGVYALLKDEQRPWKSPQESELGDDK